MDAAGASGAASPGVTGHTLNASPRRLTAAAGAAAGAGVAQLTASLTSPRGFSPASACLTILPSAIAGLVREGVVRNSIVILDEGAAAALAAAGGAGQLLHAGAVAVVSTADAALSAHVKKELVDQALVIVTGFLPDAEAAILRLLRQCAVQIVTVCSGLSLKAHECHPVEDVRAELDALEFQHSIAAGLASRMEADGLYSGSVQVRVRPLFPCEHLVMCLPSADQDAGHACGGLFIMADPVMRQVFPATLHRTGLQQRCAHVSAVTASDLPISIRLQFKQLAHILAGLMRKWKLDVSSHAFSLGSTATLVGNTLVGILTETKDDTTAGATTPATLIIVDRTLDLVTPCSSATTLMDRIVSCLARPPPGCAADAALHVVLPGSTTLPPLLGTSAAPPVAAVTAKHLAGWKLGASLLGQTQMEAAYMLQRAVLARPADVFTDAIGALADVAHTENIEVSIPPTATTKDKLCILWAAIAGAGPGVAKRHLGVLQVVSAVIAAQSEAAGTPARSKNVAQLEKLQLQCADQDDGLQSALSQLEEMCKLLTRTDKAADAKDLITVQQALTLAVRCFSLLTVDLPESGDDVASNHVSLADAVAEKRRRQAVQASLTRLAECERQLAVAFAAALEKDADAAALRELACDRSGGGVDDVKTASDDELDLGDVDGMWKTDTEPGPSANSVQCKRMMNVLHELGAARAKLTAFRKLRSGTAGAQPTSLVASLVRQLLADPKSPVPDLQHVGSAMQHLGRATIQTASSFFGKFMGSSLFGAAQQPHPADHQLIVLFVIGGTTAHEVAAVTAEVAAWNSGTSDASQHKQILVGGTTLATSEHILQAVFDQGQ